jgi:hypothetical protein
MSQPAATLYATDPATRFFLIPDGQALPTGALVLRSLRGDVLRIDPVVADIYEVPEAEAKALAARSVRALAQTLGAALKGAGEAVKEVGKIQAGVQAAAQAGPGPEAAAQIAAALGIEASQLRNDPAAVRVGLTQTLARLAADARALVAPPDPEQAAAAQAEVAQARAESRSLAAAAKARVAEEAARRAAEEEAVVNARIAEAEAAIGKTRDAAMTNVASIASDTAAAIVERLTGKAPTDAELAAAKGTV